MALVAAQDWPNDMDSRQQRTHSNSPAHTDRDANPSQASPNGATAQVAQAHNPYAPSPYSYPQAQWGMGMNGMNMSNMGNVVPLAPQAAGYFPQMQYYPQHFPPHTQMQQGSPYGSPAPGPGPMFDPNAQFAQWAYQQMMINAQQQSHQLQQQMQQQQPSPTQMQPHQQLPQPSRDRSGSHSNSASGTPTNEYYQTPFGQGSINNRFQASSPAQQGAPNNYQGFHPYRRPERGERDRRVHGDNAQSPTSSIPFQPPYARSDAAGSSSSVNSTSSASQRSRKNSNTSGSGSGSVRGAKAPPPPLPSSSASSSQQYQQPSSHHIQHTPRAPSTSSSQGSAPRSVSSTSTGSLSTASVSARTQRPSPLSQGSVLSAAERRKSRDDSDLATMLSSQNALGFDSNGPSPSVPMPRGTHGLKGRLRRALSLNAVHTLREEDEDDVPIGKGKKDKGKATGTGTTSGADGEADGDEGSMGTKKAKKSLRLFNARFNASTDNISLSSTVSSASVMIRKLGSMGRLARRNSLAGITSLFKDKDKNKGEGEGGPSKKNKGKASKSEASVSMATAELDKSNDWSAPGMEGLSPAAKLARQHTLKSNAEAAARAKAQQEAQAATATSSSNGVPAWDKNTATRRGVKSGMEDGMRVVVEDDSDDDDVPVGRRRVDGPINEHDDDDGSGSDEDSTWHGHAATEEDEDVTIRIGMEKSALSEVGSSIGHGDGTDDDLDEPWALNIRRSIERSRRPAKGILKNASTYAQDAFFEGPNLPFAHARLRANSYDSSPNNQHEAGPLARMQEPDPDHIDGLQRRNSHRSSGSSSTLKESTTDGPPLLPPLSFESTDSPESSSPALLSSMTTVTTVSAPSSNTERHAVFNHPNMNSSEPVLSSMVTSPPTLTHRSATTPMKRLAFATNLSIYDTFSPMAYDRRSEPATWSRLTPALAQKIKEELNSYKMEEMEVHAASRVHTQFFV